MDDIDALQRSRAAFQDRLEQVQDHQWDLPTPCGGWSVRDLVNHVMLGTRMSVQLLDGAGREDVIAQLDDDLLAGSTDAVADFTALADEMLARFGADGGLEGTVHHPLGDIPRTTFAAFRVGDQTTHAWDLARAIGGDEQLDADLVQRVWDDLQPMTTMLAQSGLFGDGPSGEVADDAPLQIRFLDLTGRRP